MFRLGQSYTRFHLAKESNFYLTCVDGKVTLAKQNKVELKHLLLVILVSQPLLTHSEKPMIPPCCKHKTACTKGFSLLNPTER